MIKADLIPLSAPSPRRCTPFETVGTTIWRSVVGAAMLVLVGASFGLVLGLNLP